MRKVYHKETGKVFAMKVYRLTKEQLETCLNSEDLLKPIITEFAVLKLISHPNVVKLVDMFINTSNLNFYLILEYADMGDLSNLIEESFPMSEQMILQIFKEICFGV